MPLPVSSQTYIHNPLVGVEARVAGTKVGMETSPFANFVSGIFTGAEKTTKIQEGLQELQLRPQEMELKKQQVANEAVKEERLAVAAENTQDYRNALLDIKQQQVDVSRDRLSNQLSKTRAGEHLKAQKQADDNVTQGAIDSLIVDGSVDSIDGILADSKNRSTRSLLLSKLAKDPTLGPATAQKIEDAIANGQVTGASAQRLSSMLDTLKYAKNINTSQEKADAGVPLLVQRLGVAPSRDSLVDAVKTKDGAYEIYEIKPNKIKEKIGVLVETTDPREVQAILPALAAHNRVVNMNRNMREGIQKSVSQVATTQAQTQSTQEEQPVKVQKTQKSNVQKLGLRNATLPDEEAIVDSTKKEAENIKRQSVPSEKEKRAREKTRKNFNPNYVTEDETSTVTDRTMKAIHGAARGAGVGDGVVGGGLDEGAGLGLVGTGVGGGSYGVAQ